jgi:hypothetical protein
MTREPSNEFTTDEVSHHDWREVDRRLCGLAKQRAALDAEEARWLRDAERLQIWRELGFVSLLEYMERRLGYGPHAARERLRVALVLEQQPALEAALATGQLPFSAVREISRKTTPETAPVWVAAAADKTVHQVEALVAGHKVGDLPTDPPEPDLVPRVLRYQVTPATYALMRQAKAALAAERGHHLDDDELIAALCGAVLDGDRDGRAKHQLAVVVCAKCDQAWQEGGGARLAMDAAALERARCDAQHIGSLDTDTPARAAQDVPPSVNRLVHRRDGGRCVVPGCRSARNLEIHHIIARADDGTHDPKNLVLLCDGHHAALHRGVLTIRGQAPDHLTFERRHEPETRVSGGAKLDRVTMDVDVRVALVKLGFKTHEARAAIDAARSHVGPNVSVELLLREALKRCPKPT